MTSWKTTLSAVVAAFAGFVLFSPQYFAPWMIDASKYIMLGGLASIGIFAKDSTVHSTIAQTQDSSFAVAKKGDM